MHLNRWSHGDHHKHLFENPVFKKLASQMSKDHLFRVGGTHWITPPIMSAYGLETVGGYVHLYPERYKIFFTALLGKDLNEAVGNRAHVWGEDLNWNLLSLANTKYIASERIEPSQHGLSNKLKGIYRRVIHNFRPNNNYDIIENKNVFPRFFIARSPKFFDHSNDLFNALKSVEESSLLKEFVFLEKEFENQVPFHRGDFKTAGIKVEEYVPDRIRLSLKIDGSGILVASNSYSPFWKVFVDGKERKIVPAYYAFWGVPVYKGDKEIVF